jgi:hypothetical protein
MFTSNHFGLDHFTPARKTSELLLTFLKIPLSLTSNQPHATMESVKNEFGGFEGGFQGFPKHLPDDCVEYSLFLIDSKLNSQKDLRARLEGVRRESKKLTDTLLKDYIWQRDGFSLQIDNGNGWSVLYLREKY